ncbi:MAG: hypothetical protein HC858_11010 [Brachymonas sp.]|nr:hypothetical protein [Brachymonas sp.]
MQVLGLVIGLLMAALMTGAAVAGTTGTEFQGLYDLLFGWAQGYLARAIAIAASIAGALYGLAKQNPMLAITGVIFAVILSIGPGIINGILTAVV